MSTYRLNKKSKHVAPALLDEVATFIATQEHGSLGAFDTFGPSAIPPQLVDEKAVKNGFSFIELADGSRVALLNVGAVVLLESEGNHRTLANSLEEFLLLWSKGESGVSDLDDGEALGMLAKWVKAKKLKAPKVKRFDFNAWLDGGATEVSRLVAQERRPTAAFEKLGPKMQQLVRMVGRRADDPELVAWVTKTLGKKVPGETRGDSINVVAPKHGVELAFAHDILNTQYPEVARTPRSFIPYLSLAWVNEKFGEPVFGVDGVKATEADLRNALGEPVMDFEFAGDEEPTVATWTRVVDEGAQVSVRFEWSGRLQLTVSVDSAAELASPVDAAANIFIAWAAENGLLDETKFTAHAELLAKVKQRKAPASELSKAALPRGLWDTHLRDVGLLRSDAYDWFHNFGRLSQREDFTKLFGSKVTDDSWTTVDEASKVLAKDFRR